MIAGEFVVNLTLGQIREETIQAPCTTWELPELSTRQFRVFCGVKHDAERSAGWIARRVATAACEGCLGDVLDCVEGR